MHTRTTQFLNYLGNFLQVYQLIMLLWQKTGKERVCKSDMKTVCFLKPYLNFSGLYSTDLLPCLYVQTLQEFNLFWLTSIPQSFAPQWNIPLYHQLVSNQQLVDLLFTIFESQVDTILLFFENRIYPSSPSTTLLPGNFVVFQPPQLQHIIQYSCSMVAYLTTHNLYLLCQK